MELKNYKLGECLELQRGYDLTSSQMQVGEVAVVGSNGIIGYHNAERGNSPCITVGRSGSVGKVHYYEQPTWAHNTALFVKDFKGNNPKYLYYLLKNLHLDKIFERGSSVIPSLDRKLVHSLAVPFHKNINDQRKIVAVLSALDRKIELNKQINDNLEAMAKQLYDYWFVQFDFPNEKGKPYKSSGGAMAYNERLKREIPVGWQCCCVNNLCEINKKAISKDEYHHIEYLDTGSITQGYINHTEYYRVDAAPSRAQRKVEDLTIIYSSVRPKLLHYGVLSMPKENFIVSTGFITLDAKNKIMALMVYYFLTSDIVTRYLASIADTAVSSYPSINPEDVAYLDVVLPNKDTIKKFNDIVEPMFRKMSKLRNEIAVLTKQRDELLPLLMNGQASVNSD